MLTSPQKTVYQRDVTRALNLVNAIRGLYAGKESTDDISMELAKLSELAQILTRMDARTGRRDPSARKKTALPKRG